MRFDGILLDYAIFGAAAQMRYTQAVLTVDVGVLVDVPEPNRLDILRPIYAYCAQRGYEPEGEAVRVGEWPVQFIPVFSELTREALAHAETAEIEGVPIRVLSAGYLGVIALSAGRAKDYARILALLESASTNADLLRDLAMHHNLVKEWAEFERKFLHG
jgi:hypothetical protein